MKNVDEYIAQFPDETEKILSIIRSIILKEVPNVEERISYGMPGYYLEGRPLVYFAGYKNHIGFYATPDGHSKFQTELSSFKQGKGSVQFPLNKEIPYDLILKIIKFKVISNES